MPRQATACRHGYKPKSDCHECNRIRQKKYHKTYVRPKQNQYERTIWFQNEYSAKTVKKYKGYYDPKNIITKAIFKNFIFCPPKPKLPRTTPSFVYLEELNETRNMRKMPL